ncbi:hypothetical protein DEI84_10740 [Curtobacterium sp. MCBD17_023]|nr:hypothetical protein DEI84_10740 [Curtobacterium sp. MCBD17_023]
MIRCEHCGSTLPDGAIFCGECGRAVTTSAARRTAPAEAVDRGTPPPLQQPGVPGRGVDPAADGWLPESTLDPATRAWLTGADHGASPVADATTAGRQDRTGTEHQDHDAPGSPRAGSGQADASVDRGTPAADDLAPRSAPSHVHGSGTGLGDWTGRSTEGPGAEPVEPTLDPDAFPAETLAPQDDPEVQRADAWDERGAADQGDTPPSTGAGSAVVEPVWSPPSTPAAPPTGPSWWIGRAPSAEATSEQTTPGGTGDDAGVQRTDDAPRPGDTAVFQLPAERRAPRPTPLVAPGSQSTVCHVCGHTLEPDDIFCEECGSVRPAVTAAFTGPVMPLPLARPDWAADEDALRSAVSDAHDLTEESDGLPDADSGELPDADDDAARSGPDADGRDDVAPGGRDGAETPDASGAVDPSDDRDASAGRDGHEELDDRGPDSGPVSTSTPRAPAAADSDAAGRPSSTSDDAHDDGAAGHDDGAGHDDCAGHDDGAGQAGTHGTTDVVPGDAADDRGAARSAGASDVQPDESVSARSVDRADRPGAEALPGTSPRLTTDGAPVPPVAAPLPLVAAPLPPVAQPRSGGTEATGAAVPTDHDAGPDEDVEETRIVSRAPAQAPFLLHFSTGERLGVHGSALLGRLPRPEADEQFDGLLTIRDPGKSVSKTHLELGRDGDDLWVSDRYSGNGTMIRHIDGSIRRCEPGRRYRVERGARVDIGEQFFLVQ